MDRLGGKDARSSQFCQSLYGQFVICHILLWSGSMILEYDVVGCHSSVRLPRYTAAEVESLEAKWQWSSAVMEGGEQEGDV
jgi:hypothetical protein